MAYMANAPTKPDPFPIFLNLKQAAGIIGVTSNGLRQWIMKGKGPPIYRFGLHLHRIRKDELLEWFETKKRMPNAQHNNRTSRKSVRLDSII